jgi:hypothetical protein
MQSTVETKNLINAIIKIPIEVLPDGTIVPLADYAVIDYEKCHELPTLSNTNSSSLSAFISSLVSQPDPNPNPESTPSSLAIFIEKSELLKPGSRQKSKNITFKSKSNPHHSLLRRTAKSKYHHQHPPITQDAGDSPAPTQNPAAHIQADGLSHPNS